MKLYKYYTVNKNSLSSLINKFVWFSAPNDFNDPFDTALIDNSFLRSINFNNEKILCLTEKHDNFLMWSHYSDCHKGFCIEFTDYTDEEILQLKYQGIYPKDAPNEKLSIIRNAKPVEYKSTQEIEDYVKGIPLEEEEFRKYYEGKQSDDKKKELISLIHRSSFIKHLDWSYEKEFRLINIVKNIVHPPGKITAVYFGLKMSSSDKRCIGMIASPNLNGNCKLFQMYRQKGTFLLKDRPFDLKTDLDGLEISYQ